MQREPTAWTGPPTIFEKKSHKNVDKSSFNQCVNTNANINERNERLETKLLKQKLWLLSNENRFNSALIAINERNIFTKSNRGQPEN